MTTNAVLLIRQPTISGKPCKRCESTLRYERGSRQCVNCHRAARERWREKNTAAEWQRKADDKGHGVSLDRKATMIAAQAGLCAICADPKIPAHALRVDHCHATKRVRGMLCNTCNLTLGRFNDDVDRFRKAIDYLLR